jgi:hypothetical protein
MALGTELLRQIRGDANDGDSHGNRVARLRRFATDRTLIRISPLCPLLDDLFWVTEVQSHAVVLEKRTSRDHVTLPLQRIVEVLDQGEEPPWVIIEGRIQWLTLKGTWRFLPDSPVDGLGVPRDVDFSSQTELMEMLRINGKELIASRRDSVARRIDQKTHEVFYDDSGYYLRQPARDTDSVLLIAK